jgi:hypothetical protein
MPGTVPKSPAGLGNARAERSSDVPLAFPIIIAEWDRNAREIVRAALDRYNGRHTINARVWYRDGDEVRPSKSGLTLAVKHLPALAAAIGGALAEARAAGLLDHRGEL